MAVVMVDDAYGKGCCEQKTATLWILTCAIPFSHWNHVLSSRPLPSPQDIHGYATGNTVCREYSM